MIIERVEPDFEPWRVTVAALLGHGAARRALELPDPLTVYDPAVDDPENWDELDHGDAHMERWGKALGEAHPEAGARVALACAGLILPAWAAEHQRDTRLEQALSHVRAHLAGQPDPARLERARQGLLEAARDVRWAHTADVRSACLAALEALEPARAPLQTSRAALFAYRVLGWASSESGRGGSPGLSRVWERVSQDGGLQAALATEEPAWSRYTPGAMANREVVRAHARREVLAWALGRAK